MLTALLVAFALQQSPGSISWQVDTPPMPSQEMVSTAGGPRLPAWALADPFAWERSQCSALLRGEVSLDACQIRIRSDLRAALGADLPVALSPRSLRPTLSSPRNDRPLPEPVERVCQTRTSQLIGGKMVYSDDCTVPSALNGVGTAYRLSRP